LIHSFHLTICSMTKGGGLSRVDFQPVYKSYLATSGSRIPQRCDKMDPRIRSCIWYKSAATHLTWLSLPQAVKATIDRRSAIYSSRQSQPMALGTTSGGRRMTFMQKGPRWRTMRAIVHKLIGLACPSALMENLLTPKMALMHSAISDF